MLRAALSLSPPPFLQPFSLLLALCSLNDTSGPCPTGPAPPDPHWKTRGNSRAGGGYEWGLDFYFFPPFPLPTPTLDTVVRPTPSLLIFIEKKRQEKNPSGI